MDQIKTDSPGFKYFQNNIINPLSLCQMVTEPTRITKDSCTLIDLILANSPENVKFTGTADFSGLSDHKLIYCSYSLKKIKFTPKVIKRRDFRNFAKDTFINDMENAQWDTVLGVANLNIDEATTNLENLFTSIINSNAPFREVRVTKPIGASWLSDEIVFLMDLRDRYKKKWNEIKRHNINSSIVDSPEDIFFHTRFKELKNQVNYLTRKAKLNEFNNKINLKLKDGKAVHFNLKDLNIINSKKKMGTCHLDPNKLNNSFVKNNNAHVSSNHIAKMVCKLNRSKKKSCFRI